MINEWQRKFCKQSVDFLLEGIMRQCRYSSIDLKKIKRAVLAGGTNITHTQNARKCLMLAKHMKYENDAHRYTDNNNKTRIYIKRYTGTLTHTTWQ